MSELVEKVSAIYPTCIQLAAGTYKLSEALTIAGDHILTPDTNALASGEEVIIDNRVAIAEGATAALFDVTITKPGSYEYPETSALTVPRYSTVTLTRVSIVNYAGRGVFNEGNLMIDNSTISQCKIGSGDGGGILNLGFMHIRASRVTKNSAFHRAAGISNGDNRLLAGWGNYANTSQPILVVEDCVIEGNVFFLGSGAEFKGGGLSVHAGRVTMTSSRVANNVARGAGIWVTGGELTVSTSLITGNRAHAEDLLDPVFGLCLYYNTYGSDPDTWDTAECGGMPAEFQNTPGGGLLVEGGSVKIGDGTAIRGNSATGEGDNILVSDGTLSYMFPLPAGHWLPNGLCLAFREKCETPVEQCVEKNNNGMETPPEVLQAACPCKASMAACRITAAMQVPKAACEGFGSEYCSDIQTCTAPTFTQTCDWQADPEQIGKRIYAVARSIPIDEDFPYKCAAGLLGSSSVEGQISSICAGKCPPGVHCPTAATLTAEQCPRGSYCPQGSVSPVPCPSGTYSDLPGLSAATQCMRTMLLPTAVWV